MQDFELTGFAGTNRRIQVRVPTASARTGLTKILGCCEEAIFGIAYSGQITDGAHDHGFKANLTVRF